MQSLDIISSVVFGDTYSHPGPFPRIRLDLTIASRRVMSFSGKTRRQSGVDAQCTKRTCPELRFPPSASRLDGAALCRERPPQHTLTLVFPLFPVRAPSVCLSRPRHLPDLAAASLYLVSRVWKTLNGFLMTRRNRRGMRDGC